MRLVEQASFAGIAFALARIHVDSLLLGKSVTTYWCVPGMFFGDKMVTGLPKSNKMTTNLR